MPLSVFLSKLEAKNARFLRLCVLHLQWGPLELQHTNLNLLAVCKEVEFGVLQLQWAPLEVQHTQPQSSCIFWVLNHQDRLKEARKL